MAKRRGIVQRGCPAAANSAVVAPWRPNKHAAFDVSTFSARRLFLFIVRDIRGNLRRGGDKIAFRRARLPRADHRFTLFHSHSGQLTSLLLGRTPSLAVPVSPFAPISECRVGQYALRSGLTFGRTGGCAATDPVKAHSQRQTSY